MSLHTIETNKFELEEKVYFKILVRTRLYELWWFYLLVLLVVVRNLGEFGDNIFSTCMVVLGGLYPFFGFFYLYSVVISKKNRSLFEPRIMQFDESSMIIMAEDGTENNKVPFNKIVRIIETRTFFLLYRNEHHFFYVPKNSFKTGNDLLLFAERIRKSLRE